MSSTVYVMTCNPASGQDHRAIKHSGCLLELLFARQSYTTVKVPRKMLLCMYHFRVELKEQVLPTF